MLIANTPYCIIFTSLFVDVVVSIVLQNYSSLRLQSIPSLLTLLSVGFKLCQGAEYEGEREQSLLVLAGGEKSAS